jgi:hypothetical protein
MSDATGAYEIDSIDYVLPDPPGPWPFTPAEAAELVDETRDSILGVSGQETR